MDIKNLISWAIRHWYWFCISLAATIALGLCYYFFTAPAYEVRATLMLRQTEAAPTTQQEMINMMGYGGGQVAIDEVEILTSRTLHQKVVDKLDLRTAYYKKGKRFWVNQYPNHDISVTLPDTLTRITTIKIRIDDTGLWHVKIKNNIFSESFTCSPQENSKQTAFGTFTFAQNKSGINGKYKVEIIPSAAAVERTRLGMKVNRLSKESNIIELTSVSNAPRRQVDIINTLLDFYNINSSTDKNILAKQTEEFLQQRLNVLAKELDEAEVEIEQYKRQYNIANINNTAEAYRNNSDSYERKVAELDAELEILNHITKQLNDPDNENNILPSNIGIDDEALQQLIIDYNGLILRRIKLLETASNDNPTVQNISSQISTTRLNLTSGIAQASNSITLRRTHLLSQQRQYENRLKAMPEQERHYFEMLRAKSTKENQYVYLINKREENSLLLNSEALPVRIIDRAQASPSVAKPNLPKILFIVIFLGLCLPFGIYMLDLFRKEYL